MNTKETVKTMIQPEVLVLVSFVAVVTALASVFVFHTLTALNVLPVTNSGYLAFAIVGATAGFVASAFRMFRYFRKTS